MRQLILEMRVANPLWGAPRIHGQLLKLGIDGGQTMVAKYMGEDLPSHHADAVASMDMSDDFVSAAV